jgi:uncharacterized tellurite resistance protein B-like protein
MDCSAQWLIPEISLETEARQEMDCVALRNLPRHELLARGDQLIRDWYKQREIIDRALGRVRHLEVALVLAQMVPADGHVSEVHLEMARELMDEMGITQADLNQV